MNNIYADLKAELIKKNIRLSHQRLIVLEYLSRNRIHPTVDRIFTDLQPSIPTLSRTTIYNTLKVLMDAGLVRVISIEDNETRYDIETADHGHFKCEKCDKIYNFRINPRHLDSEDLYSFQVRDRNVYFKGICPQCLSGKDTKDEEED